MQIAYFIIHTFYSGNIINNTVNSINVTYWAYRYVIISKYICILYILIIVYTDYMSIKRIIVVDSFIVIPLLFIECMFQYIYIII